MAIRDERKQQTRQALMEAALAMVATGRSFPSLSLREVTRDAGVVPASFYRHFRDMDQLGLALVDETCQRLRKLIRAARTTQAPGDNMLAASVSTFLLYVNANRPAFHFLTRERYGGTKDVREAIAREIRGFTLDLAADFARFPHFNQLPRHDVEMMSTLLVNTVVSALGEMLELPADHPDAQGAIAKSLSDQLRVIVLGGLAWRPGAKVPTSV
ncbi:MAG: TetR family transcriptional regulator [Panacagrimonas sp.]|jgi:AcrR family transcriptional regulator|nr:HTH-type transcriptional repressor FabR [Panacagrimonas sp.]MCC2656839.1 TetR family transcriptional regulator [Panacagrimonas sp.]